MQDGVSTLTLERSIYQKEQTANPGQKVIASIVVLDGTALDVVEVVEVDVLEDDAIFDRRPEGPSR